jgi:phosphoglycerate kinase
VDFNVPIDKRGDIIDDTRIRESLPTLIYLAEKGAKTIVISHLGRPGGKWSEQYTMDKVAKHLSLLLQKQITKLDDCVGPEVEQFIDTMKPGDIVVLENVRFHSEEEKNDPEFCRQLARWLTFM